MSGNLHNDERPYKGQGDVNEEELASKTLQMEAKRFYIDVKQNKRGRFIKIVEVDAAGRKSRLIFAMSTAAAFRDKLSEFSEFNISQGAKAAPDENGTLKSDVIHKDDKRYYLDLKENQRGKFLRVSMTIPLSRQRFQIAIPAVGLIDLHDDLSELLKEYAEESSVALPEAKSLRVDNKLFYFDVGENNRGTFMRISEVRTNYRTAITIPEKSWSRFRDVVNEFTKLTTADSSAKPNGE